MEAQHSSIAHPAEADAGVVVPVHVLGRLEEDLADADVDDVGDDGGVGNRHEEVERALLHLEVRADADEGEHVHDDVQGVDVEVRGRDQPEVLLVCVSCREDGVDGWGRSSQADLIEATHKNRQHSTAHAPSSTAAGEMAYCPMSQCRRRTQSCSARHAMVTSVVQSGMRCMHARSRPGRCCWPPPPRPPPPLLAVDGGGRAMVVVVVVLDPRHPGDATADMDGLVVL